MSLAAPKLGQNVISLPRYRLVVFRHCQCVIMLDGSQNFLLLRGPQKPILVFYFGIKPTAKIRNSGNWGVRQVSQIQRGGIFWKSCPWLNLLICKVVGNSKGNITLPDLTAIQQFYFFLTELCIAWFNKVLSVQACKHWDIFVTETPFRFNSWLNNKIIIKYNYMCSKLGCSVDGTAYSGLVTRSEIPH